MDQGTQTVGTRLREIREARGKTLVVIAGISESYLSLLGTGKRAEPALADRGSGQRAGGLTERAVRPGRLTATGRSRCRVGHRCDP